MLAIAVVMGVIVCGAAHVGIAGLVSTNVTLSDVGSMLALGSNNGGGGIGGSED